MQLFLQLQTTIVAPPVMPGLTLDLSQLTVKKKWALVTSFKIINTFFYIYIYRTMSDFTLPDSLPILSFDTIHCTEHCI